MRLQIRDFKGHDKDYAKADDMFPTVADVKKARAQMPPKLIRIVRFGNLLFIFYLLDIFAQLALYLPYLRTFFRLSTTTLDPCRVSGVLEPDKKVKLCNTLAYWDKADRAIWLRPRGMNVLQVPLVVAKLNLDSLGDMIVSQEIRFSSGAPFILAVFLWAAYQMFSAAMPAGSGMPSAGQFVGMAAAFFIFFGFINLVIIRCRMAKLAQEALAEIKAG